MGAAPPALPLAQLLAHAADAVASVVAGRSLTDALARVPADARPGTQALAFHAMRRLGAARAVRDRMAAKPPPPWLDALLLTSLSLMWPEAEPAPYAEHTLVDQAVAAARRRSPSSAGFVNALLRRFARERSVLVESAQRRPEGAFNHPRWWVERLQRDWPERWRELLHANQMHPPMTLRVNARRGDVPAYAARLATQGVRSTWLAEQALQLAVPLPVQALPGFADGDVSVQDAHAQRAAPLLLGPGGAAAARVLDACAAPGGKTAHLLELGVAELLAIDVDPARLERVRETLQRLRLAHEAVELRVGDAREPAAWWDGRPFDAILLDAPCSASGIVRRHPDIRWLRRAGDVSALAELQGRLLDALWPLLAPGGRLLYATCSVFRAEGQQVIDAFLQRVCPSGARLDPASPGHLLPLADNGPEGATPSSGAAGDGFFYALLHKP